MKVLFVTPELAPWVKTGGLGDVAAALPPALRQAGVDLRILAPSYPALAAAFPDSRAVTSFGDFAADFAASTLREADSGNGQPIWLLDCPEYFHRPGSPYVDPEGQDWPDNHLRFGLLARVAAWLGSADSALDWKPDVIHCHDWQTALAPVYLHLSAGARAKTVITIHNLAFQGLFPPTALTPLGLPDSLWHMDGVEYFGHLSFLKGGLQLADAITTVSPTYAREIQIDAGGMGLAGLLRHRADRVTGILNGIDTATWNPADDPHLTYAYDAKHLAGKAKNRVALQKEFSLARRSDLPLIGVVSRLTYQKGLDLLPLIALALAELPVQLVVLGTGEKKLETAFADLADRYPHQFAVRIGFDEGLAHRIEAGADMFLMPSRFEPCGLNQMYSLRYGTPPIVRATGGLADTVVDGVNGFSFDEPTPAALLATIRRATEAWHDKRLWKRMQADGMGRDFGWENAAQEYAGIYASP